MLGIQHQEGEVGDRAMEDSIDGPKWEGIVTGRIDARRLVALGTSIYLIVDEAGHCSAPSFSFFGCLTPIYPSAC